MRKLIATEFVAVDGVMEAPHEWSFDWWSDEIGQYKNEELFSVDDLLLGRLTYEGFAAAWPDRTDEAGYADRINAMTKHVATRTLKSADWQNSHVIDGNLVEAVETLKQHDGQDILIFGSADLFRYLLAQGLIDEIRMMVFPVSVGHGKTLFGDEASKAKLKLTDHRTFDTGVIVLTYAPDRTTAD